MKKLYTESGFLSEEGKLVFKEVLDSKIDAILSQGESISEIQILGSLLHKRIGDAVSAKVQDKLAQQK